jgi:energy-coupling factor transporter ATP-binding protein EcfA2
VALARAANSGFEVFFADEPTGNVGQQNEHVIFQFLRDLVDEHDKSVIIVTHNIEKALEYADELIIISHQKNCGEINEANKLEIRREQKEKFAHFAEKDAPYPLTKKLLDDKQEVVEITNPVLIEKISEIMSDDMQPLSLHHFQATKPQQLHFQTEKVKIKKGKNSILTGISKQFQALLLFLSFQLIPLFMRLFSCPNKHFAKAFIRKDLSQYYKNKQLSFFTIIFLSLLAISLFNSWNKILYRRLNNPFVNILLVKNNSGKPFSEIKETLLESDFKNRFVISEVSSVRSVSLRFSVHAQKNEFQYISGRSITSDNPILRELQSLQAENPNSESRFGLYVTSRFLERLQYESDTKFIAVSIGNRMVYVPIIGVYKFLPGDTYLVSNQFFQLLQSGGFYRDLSDKITVADAKGKDISHLVGVTQQETASFAPDFSRVYERDNFITISFMKEHDSVFYDSLLVKLRQANPDFDLIPYVQPNLDVLTEAGEIVDSGWFFLHRQGIQKAEELKVELAEKGLQTDLEKISTQKDFHLISRLLHAAIFLLILLTFISTLIYIRYSYYLHIYQQRMQVGIIKSLGIANATFAYIFRLELLTYLISIYFISFLTIFLLQGVNYLLLFLGLASQLYLQVFAIWSLLQIALIFISSLFSLEYVLRKILYRTTGDLIYDRKMDEI